MTNRYLRAPSPRWPGNTPPILDVVGEVPDYLDGRYLRNGPNPIGPIDPERYHWFAGDGMVHGLRLRDGKAEWYRNRYVAARRPAGRWGASLGASSSSPGWARTPT